MNSKPHRTNSDFQLRHFMAGDCHTPDGAWSLLYDQKIDIETKLQHCEVQQLRREAKIAAAEEILSLPFEQTTIAARLNAKADILEANAGFTTWELNKQAAMDEVATIKKLMAELEPMLKYSNLPLLQATEAVQQEEWLLELKSRAENHMVASGRIPPDELRFMRNHPDFEAEIIPHIQELRIKLGQVTTPSEGLLLLSKRFQLISE